MRSTIVAILLFFAAELYGQETRISMECHPCSLSLLSDSIERACRCRITSVAESPDQLFLLNFSARNKTVSRLFKIAFRGHPYVLHSHMDNGHYSYDFDLPAPVKPVQSLKGNIKHGSGLPFKLLTPVVLSWFNGIDHVAAITAPGAFDTIGDKTRDRVVTTNVANLVAEGSGVLPGAGAGNALGLAIHGLHSLNTKASITIVRDNFIWNTIFGSFQGINPFDYPVITILKDAGSSAIWGGFSSNNVIVFSSAEGKYGQPLAISVTMNTSLTQRPDLFYRPRLSSDSFISAQKSFFRDKYYDNVPNPDSHPFTPAVKILRQLAAKTLTQEAADQQLALLGKGNLLTDIDKYFYRPAFSQQFHAGISGSGRDSRYYVGLGIDHDPTTQTRNKDDRFTLHANYTFRSRNNRLETTLLFDLADINRLRNNPGSIPVSTPYAQLADAVGHPLSVTWQNNDSWTDTAGGGHYQDWRYRPLDELRLADNRYSRRNVYGQINLTWHIISGFSASSFFRLYRDRALEKDLYSTATYYVRNTVNTNMTINGNTILYGTPPGPMRNTFDTTDRSYNWRTQLKYTSPDKKSWRLTGLLGAEISDVSTTGRELTEQAIGTLSSTTALDTTVQLFNRYASAFANGSFSLHQRYSLYGTYRMDAANFIGIDTYRKWVPFWSMGYSEQLLKIDTIEGEFPTTLKARVSYGRNGSPSNRTASLSTQLLALSSYGTQQSGIVNAPDPGLTYEKNRILNLGLDFNLLRDADSPHGRIYGAIDLYAKWATNLLGMDSLAPSTGWTSIESNSASIRGTGLDFALYTDNIRGDLSWSTRVLLSLVKDKVIRYGNQPSSPVSYVQMGVPKVGKSPAELISYKWAGLDGSNGDPMGWLGKRKSNDYVKLQNDATGGLAFSGSWMPQFFGNILNTFRYKNVSLSLAISFEADYYIRRPSLSYSAMAADVSGGEIDFNRRWQTSGDEKRTNVPSLPAVNSTDRDLFYQYSEATVIRADNVRWKDWRLDYTLKGKKGNALKEAVFYLYINNPGIIYRANKYKIDPESIGNWYTVPVPRSWSLGVRFNY
ncbi:MAG TPA: hypothetical protein VGN00_12655 [Puia sp.]|jgi:hypothetical protein